MRHLLLPVCTVLALFGITLGCAHERAIAPAENDLAGSGLVIENVDVADAITLMRDRAGDAHFHIIDVRTPLEFGSGHIQDAVSLDYNGGVFRASLDSLDKNDTYLLYCRSGSRSAGARDLMKYAGFTSVYNMLGGINQWMADGYPLTKPE